MLIIKNRKSRVYKEWVKGLQADENEEQKATCGLRSPPLMKMKNETWRSFLDDSNVSLYVIVGGFKADSIEWRCKAPVTNGTKHQLWCRFDTKMNYKLQRWPLRNYIELNYNFPNTMFKNNNFIWKFGIGSNLLFDKSKFFKFGFELNFIIVFKVVKIKDLKMTTQTLSFSNSSFMIS